MALIQPEVVGLARVNVVQSRSVSAASYEFVNGFDSQNVKGASPGAPVIYSPSDGIFVLFLSEPVAPGSMATQGGIKARVDLVAVSSPTTPVPTPVSPPFKARWFYGVYALVGNPLYSNVDPEKAIAVEILSAEGDLFQNDAVFDIVVFRDPMTEFVAKKFVG